MKTKFIFIVFSLLTFNSHAQDSLAGEGMYTTEEEFNYIRKGYKVQISSGLDMKRGYTFVPIGKPIKNADNEFAFSFLFREEKAEVAAIMVKAVVINSWKEKNTYYFCIPLNNPELTNQYYKDVSVLDASAMAYYAKITSLMFANAMASMVELQKKSKP